jgi:alanine dehydrogenase
MGASVTVLDINGDRLRALQATTNGRVYTEYSNPASIAAAVHNADVLIGAVLVAGARAPRLVTEEMVASMARGAVVIDVAIDQGGCIATARLTTHSHPTYDVGGVIHYCVGNMPGAVPRTSTLAIVNAAYPWLERLAAKGVSRALTGDPALAAGANVVAGSVTYQRVAEAVGLPYVELTEALRKLPAPASGRTAL